MGGECVCMWGGGGVCMLTGGMYTQVASTQIVSCSRGERLHSSKTRSGLRPGNSATSEVGGSLHLG